MKVYAWGWTPNPDKIDEWRDKIPGLGVIHYPATFHKARKGDICFINSEHSAKRAIQYADVWSLAILGDERNVTGPSGEHESPKDYMDRLRPARNILREASVPVANAGLAMAGGHFDHDYQQELLHFTGVSNQNFRCYRYPRVVRGMQWYKSRKWFLTMIPLRINWWPLKYNTFFAWFRQAFLTPLSPEEQLKTLYKRTDVVGVGIWCLREGRLGDGYWQGWHGLIDRNDRLTWQGEMVKRVLNE